MELNIIKKSINDYIISGTVNKSVIDTLIVDDKIVNKESELWDFKEKPSGGNNLSKTLLQIVCFHNTYGGYLILGIGEKSDKFFPVGIPAGCLNEKQLRDKIVSYTGDSIDVTYQEFVCEIEKKEYNLGLLFIPKRPHKVSPVYFGKDAKDDKGKFIFEKDKLYMRFQDNSTIADKKECFSVIFGDRKYYTDDIKVKEKKYLTHNLPDRSIICSKFIGRDSIIEDLWKWLGDSLSYTKLIAGAGGNGKSSIAYEFAEEICRSRPYGFCKVIWLTGKSRQFLAIQDDYMEIGDADFCDLESMLKALCDELAMLEDEIVGVSVSLMKKNIHRHLQELPVFVIIDDVDSLEIEEQRKVLDTVLQLSNGESRFLLTTRMNFSYSEDSCIKIPGLSLPDFTNYVNELKNKFKVDVKNSLYKRLRKVTDGSPLFAESVLRLVKNGERIDNAIKYWEGQSGETARQAAFEREIGMLSSNSKRILFIIAYLKEASATEIKSISGYSSSVFSECINQLNTLFLITSPPIISSEKRFGVTNGTALYVISNPNGFVPDKVALMKNIKNHSQANRKQTAVGKAIIQANFLLESGRKDEAIATIKAVMKSHPNNKDLYYALGKCYFNKTPPLIKDAISAFFKASELEQRKETFYDLWLSAANVVNDISMELDIVNIALKRNVGNRNKWLRKRAFINYHQRDKIKGSLNEKRELTLLKESVNDFNCVRSNSYNKDIIPIIQEINDKIFSLQISSDSHEGWIDAIETTIKAINNKDYRPKLYHDVVKAAKILIDYEKKVSKDNRSLSVKPYLQRKFQHQLQGVIDIVNDRSNKQSNFCEIHNELCNLMETIETGDF